MDENIKLNNSIELVNFIRGEVIPTSTIDVVKKRCEKIERISK